MTWLMRQSRLGSALIKFGDAWDEVAAWEQEQREEESNDLPRPDYMDHYASLLSSTNHPPNECSDPFSCEIHGEQYREYYGYKEED